LGGTIDLEKSTYSLESAMCEPEQFPGLIYRMEDPKVVILLFTSGNIVVTGAKKEQEVHHAVAILQRTLGERTHSLRVNRTRHHSTAQNPYQI
jgi:transcription initiation factor TFIID TATA-box-binding protein